MTSPNAFCGGSSSDFWEHYLQVQRANGNLVPDELPVRLGARILSPKIEVAPPASLSEFVGRAEPYTPPKGLQA